MRIHTKLATISLLSIMLLNVPRVGAQDPLAGPSRQEEQRSRIDATPSETKITLKEGTEVHLKLAQKLTSKTATTGEPVEFVLADDLKIGEDTVARKGTRALGIVEEGKKSEKQRKEASQLSMRFDHMNVGNAVVQLRGQQSSKGKRDTDKMVAFSILFGLSGLLATSGKKFVIPEGTAATAYVDQDIELPVLGPDDPST
jgi:hypothetical protein